MAGFLYWLTVGTTALVVLATLLPLSKIPHGTIRGFSFFRLQLIWIAILFGALALFVPQGFWFAVVLGATILVQLIYVAKFTPLWTRQSVNADERARKDTDSHVSLMAANIKMSNRDYDALINLAQEQAPDILMVIEVDQRWIAALEQSSLAQDYPHWVKQPYDTGYGLCVLSRLDLSQVEVRHVVTEGVPSIRTAVTLRNGDKFRLYVVHPEPPVFNHDTLGRDSEIAHVGLEAEKDDLPVIVTGDLNDVAWSTTTRRFQRLSGLLDPRVGRGFFNTFNAFHWWARWPLDHLFHSSRFRFLEMSRLPKIGSDHFPMMFKLAFEGTPAQNSDPGEVDEEEKAAVKEMVSEEKKRNREPLGSDWEQE